MTRLKICGIQREEDLRFCCRIGVDLAGLVVEYPQPVPWNLTRTEAVRLLAAMEGSTQGCMVVGTPPRQALTLARELRPGWVQLHGQETLEETQAMAIGLSAMGIRTVKAIPLRPDGSCELEGYPVLEDAVRALCRIPVDALLIDSRSATDPAAKSRRLDPELYLRARAVSSKPVVLAGGLTLQTLPTLLERLHPQAVDLLSGAEERPGVKSHAVIREVCRLVRQAPLADGPGTAGGATP